METLFFLPFLVLVAAMVTGSLSAFIAIQKGYSGVAWFFIGFFTLIAGLIAAAGLPDKTLREDLQAASRSIRQSAGKTGTPEPPDPDTWVCSKCFRVNPNSEDECYKCQTKRRD